MKIFNFVLIVCGLVIFYSCSDDEMEQVDACKLKLGQTLDFPDADISITFSELLEDSRCPVEILCDWEGQIKVKLLVNDIDPIELISRVDNPELAFADYNGRTIELVSVRPEERYLDVEIDEDEYELKLQVK